jgi:hypothetical protein
LADGEDEATMLARLRDISSQADLLPALVLSVADGAARVMLADGRQIELGADQGWNGQAPATLVKRGDLVRVLRSEAAAAASDASTDPASKPVGPSRHPLLAQPAAACTVGPGVAGAW